MFVCNRLLQFKYPICWILFGTRREIVLNSKLVEVESKLSVLSLLFIGPLSNIHILISALKLPFAVFRLHYLDRLQIKSLLLNRVHKEEVQRPFLRVRLWQA